MLSITLYFTKIDVDGNHRANNAYLKGEKKIKVYFVANEADIDKFTEKTELAAVMVILPVLAESVTDEA